MGVTDNLRKHHKELLDTTSKLSILLQVDRLRNDAANARGLLSMLAGKLAVHLVMEDKSLYPHFLTHKDERIRSLAHQYINEMGMVRESFEAYSKRWSTSAKIQDNPEDFIKETKGILNILLKRIEKEDYELYPLFEREGG